MLNFGQQNGTGFSLQRLSIAYIFCLFVELRRIETFGGSGANDNDISCGFVYFCGRHEMGHSSL